MVDWANRHKRQPPNRLISAILRQTARTVLHAMPATNPMVDPNGIDPRSYCQTGSVCHIGRPQHHGNVAERHFSETTRFYARATGHQRDELVCRASIDISVPYRDASAMERHEAIWGHSIGMRAPHKVPTQYFSAKRFGAGEPVRNHTQTRRAMSSHSPGFVQARSFSMLASILSWPLSIARQAAFLSSLTVEPIVSPHIP